MSDIAIITIAGILLVASIANLIAIRKVQEDSAVSNKKSDILIRNLAEVHTLTNSNLTKVKVELESANERIINLENLIVSIREARTIDAIRSLR